MYTLATLSVINSSRYIGTDKLGLVQTLVLLYLHGLGATPRG